MEHLVLFIALALLAEILGTVGGFGSSLFFVPIAGYFMDFHSVLALTALFHLSSNVIKIVVFRKGFDQKLAVAIGVPALVFVVLGAWLTRFVNTAMLETGLALFLIVLSVVLLAAKDFKITASVPNAIGGGAASGFLAGFVGTGGAIRGLALAAFDLEKATFVATSAVIDLVIDSGRSIMYFANGFVDKQVLALIPVLIVVSFTGTMIGKKILDCLSERAFKSIVLLLILATGVVTLAKSLNA